MVTEIISRLLKTAHLNNTFGRSYDNSFFRARQRLATLRIKTLPQERPSVLFRISGALHLDIFEQPYNSVLFPHTVSHAELRV